MVSQRIVPCALEMEGRATQIAVIVALILCLASGCATIGPESRAGAGDFVGRASSRSDGRMRVSTSVLSAEESFQVYGVSLASKGIQPVWIEVENHDDTDYWLMSPGVDPNFFPPSEAADALAAASDRNKRLELEQHFADLSFHNPVPSGQTVSGFVLANLDQGVKMVQVDLVASGREKSFSFLARIPGFYADYSAKKVFARPYYARNNIVDYTNDGAFRAALESLPCCATDKAGSRNGDPLNLIVVGGLDDAFPAFIRRGWRPTEQTHFASVTKMVMSALSGDRYPYAPVSPLYLFGRPQDLALQKARDNIHQRNHLRLWLAPMRYHGKPVWVGQISRDIGTRFTIHSLYLTTHKIDPDVDEALTALMEDMAYSQNLVKLAMVKGVGVAPKSEPRHNLTTDPYYTIGFRGVLFFDSQPTGLADIIFLRWEGVAGGFFEKSSSGPQ